MPDLRKNKRKLKALRILDCAEAIMVKNGLEALNMDALAADAGIAKGTLYLYFDSKEEVIAQLTIRARNALLEQFSSAVAKCDAPLDQIRAILWANFAFRKINKLYHDLVAFHEVNKNLNENEELQSSGLAFQNFIVSVIQNAQERGQVKTSISAAEFSFMMWGTSHGILQLIDTKQPLLQAHLPDSTEIFFKNFVELIIAGIEA